MLRFSIRETMLVMLCVACFVGWWKEYASAAIERDEWQNKLDEQIQQLQESLTWNRAKVYVLSRENSQLEWENARLKRRMLEHDSQLDRLLDRYRHVPSGS